MAEFRINKVVLIISVVCIFLCAKYGYSEETSGDNSYQGLKNTAYGNAAYGGYTEGSGGYPKNSSWYVLGQTGRDLTEPKLEDQEEVLRLRKPISFSCDTSEAYNDNVFLVPRGTKCRHDFVTTISPRMSFVDESSDNFFSMSYGADQYLYSVYGTNKIDKVDQDVEVLLDLFQDSPVKTTIRNSMQRTTTPSSPETNAFVKRVCNTFDYRLEYDLSPKSAIALKYNNNLQNYIGEQFEQDSYMDNTLSPVFYWYVSPKTTLSAQYDFITDSFYNYNDFNNMCQQTWLGIDEKITPKLSISFKGGCQYRKFSNSDKKNSVYPITTGSLDYQWSVKTSLHAMVSYTTEHSIFSSTGYMKCLNVGSCFQCYPFGNTGVKLGGYYAWNGYTLSATRTYSIFSRIEYRFKQWLSFYTEYDYRTASSTIHAPEPTNGIATVGAIMDF